MDLTEKRIYPRRSLEIPVEYSMSILEFREMKKIHLKGMTTDISDKGLGLVTEYPLEPGHVLVVNNCSRTLFQKTAIVRWTKPIDASFRVGLEFK